MRKNNITRFCERWGDIVITREPSGGFIAPNGRPYPTNGNHEALAQQVRTTVKSLIQAGMIRFHVSTKNRFGVSIGIDAPRVPTEEQLRSLSTILVLNSPCIVMVQQVGKRYEQFGDAYTEKRRGSTRRVINYLRGPNDNL